LLSSPVDARRFFERWKESGHELAVSYHHVEECAQLASDASINRRLAVFWEFPGIWYAQPGSGEVWAREIQVQLLHLSGATLTPDYECLRAALFHRVKPEALQRDLFGALPQFRKGRLLHEAAATLDNHSNEFAEVLRDSGIKPRRLRNSIFTAEMAKLWIEHVRKLKLPPSLAIFAGVEDRVTQAAAEGVSVREAAERYHNLTGMRALRAAPDADLGELSVFFFVARRVASGGVGQVVEKL